MTFGTAALPHPAWPPHDTERSMSEIDKKSLDANFDLWRDERVPDEDEGTAFELYAIGEVLKDQDLSDDDIDSGRIGGGDDGGIDGMYFFVDGTLVREDDDPPPGKTQVAELVLVQAKRSGGFSETVVERITNFTRDIFEWEIPVEDLVHLNGGARDCIELFRRTYDKIIEHAPRLRVSVYYVTGSESTPNPKVDVRVSGLATYVVSKISHAQVGFELWDCIALLDAVRTTPQQTFRVPTVQMFATDDEAAVVCLVRVTDMAAFLGDDTGNQRRSLLESNVRAYQGNVQVNKDIRRTLETGDWEQDFWWFNNGVTIVAHSCHFAGRNLVMDRPQIVNGLQTCHEVFEYVTRVNPTGDQRAVLLRVVIPPDPETRNNIIKATNFQTVITPISLKAMDKLHFNIEDRLQLYGLYYERRKGEYRAQRKPRADIVSMRDLGKAVIAIALRRPDTARARPGTMLNRTDRYEKVFPDDSDTELYATCIRIDRRIEKYLKSESGLARSVRADLRYYVALMVTCAMAEKAEPSATDIAALGDSISGALTIEVIADAVQEVTALYEELGGTDKVSKGPDLIASLNGRINDLWPGPQ